MAIYMKIDGANGDATATGHNNWIEIQSMHYGIVKDVNTSSGNINRRIKSEPFVGEMMLHKTADSASIALMTAAASNKVIPSILIESCHSDNNGDAHSKYKLTNVIVSEYVDSHDGSTGLPQESLRLNFTQIEKTFIPRDAANKAKSPITGGYNIETGELA